MILVETTLRNNPNECGLEDAGCTKGFRMLDRLLNRLLRPLIKMGIRSELRKIQHLAQSSTRDYVFERSVEYAYALDKLNEFECYNVLDVGSGSSPFPALLQSMGYRVAAIDSGGDYWSDGCWNPYFLLTWDDILHSSLPSAAYDGITCISVIEHIEDHNKAISEMVRLLRPGGYLIISFPYCHDEYCENVYGLPEADEMSSTFRYIAQAFDEDIINGWIKSNNLERMDECLFSGWTGKHWRCGERRRFARKVANREEANGICLCLRQRC